MNPADLYSIALLIPAALLAVRLQWVMLQTARGEMTAARFRREIERLLPWALLFVTAWLVAFSLGTQPGSALSGGERASFLFLAGLGAMVSLASFRWWRPLQSKEIE